MFNDVFKSFMIFLSLILFCNGCENANDPEFDGEEINIAVVPNNPPFQFKVEDKLLGATIDITNLYFTYQFSDNLNYISVESMKDATNGAISGEYDIILGCYKNSIVQHDTLVYCKFSEEPIYIFVDDSFIDWEDLIDYKGCVVEGVYLSNKLQNYIDSNLDITSYRTVEACFTAVNEDVVDYCIYPYYQGKWALINLGINLKTVYIPDDSMRIRTQYICFRKSEKYDKDIDEIVSMFSDMALYTSSHLDLLLDVYIK